MYRLSDYEKLTENIKIHKKDHRKFIFDFRIDGKRYRKTYIIKAENWSKADCKRKAKIEFSKYYEKQKQMRDSILSENTKMDVVFNEYQKTLKDTSWKQTKISFYSRYISPKIGSMQIGSIKEMNITKIIKNLEDIGLKPRTIRTTIEILKPLFEWAVRNKIILTNPAYYIYIEVPSSKKMVTSATEKFKVIYNGINDYYKNDPFYRALFLFGFTGRRKSEILNLTWERIDLDKSYYWLEHTKNEEKQKYLLPDFIKQPLLEIPVERKGLVFKSPVTGKRLKNTDRQMNNLKRYLQMPELTMHYMRNIIVSALAEQGVEAIYLSGILGHKDINTINKYLSNNYLKSSKIGLDIMENIL
jgi:integrase